MYGRRLKSLRKENGWTIKECAKLMEMSPSTYAGYEQKYRKPPIEVLLFFSEFYNVSVDYILGLSDDRDFKKWNDEMSKYFEREHITWNGVELTDKELKPIKEILEMVVRDRMPYINASDDSNNDDNDNDNDNKDKDNNDDNVNNDEQSLNKSNDLIDGNKSINLDLFDSVDESDNKDKEPHLVS